MSVSPNNGTALSTTFHMSALNWLDTDLPIQYSFGFQTATSNSTLQTSSERMSVASLLVSGLRSNNYQLICFAVISDSFNATSLALFPVTVRPQLLAGAEELLVVASLRMRD
eukprot:gene46949-60647_t